MRGLSIDQNILVGKPIIKGSRLAVEFLIDLLAEGWSEEEVLKNFELMTRGEGD